MKKNKVYAIYEVQRDNKWAKPNKVKSFYNLQEFLIWVANWGLYFENHPKDIIYITSYIKGVKYYVQKRKLTKNRNEILSEYITNLNYEWDDNVGWINPKEKPKQTEFNF